MDRKISQIEELFAITSSGEEFSGMLVPNESYVHSYNKPALYVYGNLYRNGENVGFCGGIRSIDDSFATVLGPKESLEKATKRLTSFQKFIESWHPFMPPELDFSDWARNNGCYFQNS